jgi:cytochrome c oxidase assembly factor 6
LIFLSFGSVNSENCQQQTTLSLTVMSKQEAETASKPPSRRERQNCWKVRDEYFACLESCGILDPETMNTKDNIREKGKSCLEKKKQYEDACMASWVLYSISRLR